MKYSDRSFWHPNLLIRVQNQGKSWRILESKKWKGDERALQQIAMQGKTHWKVCRENWNVQNINKEEILDWKLTIVTMFVLHVPNLLINKERFEFMGKIILLTECAVQNKFERLNKKKWNLFFF